MLSGRRDDRPDVGEDLRTLEGAEGSRDFHAHLHHAQVPLGLIVGEGDCEVRKEPQDVIAVVTQADDQVVAWKVGGIPPHLRPVLGQDWVTGPIYSKRQKIAGDAAVIMPVFEGGFAAVEAEIILEFGDLAGLETPSPSAAEIIPFIARCYIGVEIASSPMPEINNIGPLAVISDFGNNHGMIIGQEIKDWSPDLLSSIDVKTYVEGELVGAANPPAPPAGPMGAAAFLVSNLKRRGRPVPAGLRVSSGALTGIHDVLVGQHSTVVFDGIGEIEIDITALTPED